MCLVVLRMRGKVRELSRQLACRDKQVAELTAAQDVARQEAERHVELVRALQRQIADYDARHGGLESAAGHAEQRLAAVQQELGVAQRHVQQLDAQIRLLRGVLIVMF